MAAASATAVALYEHVCPTCGLFFCPPSSTFFVVVVVLLLFLLPVWGCFRSCCDESSEVRPGQILGSQIAIGQAHASGQKKNLEGTVHRGSWDQAWMHLPGRDESSKSSHGAGMAAGGRWQALFVEGEGGRLKGVRGWEGCSTRVRREQHQHARRPRGISARKTLCTVQ